MLLLVKWLLSAFIIIIAAYILPGVHVTSFASALILSLILGILNAFIKPILVILTLPITFLTLGLFVLVINAILIIVASYIVPGVYINGFFSALLFGVVLSILNTVFLKRLD